MPTIAPPPVPLVQLPALPIYRFSVNQYHRLIAEGILGSEDPVELLEGLIVIKGNSTLAPAIEVRSPEAGDGCRYPPLAIRRFTLPEYHRMLQLGILSEDDPGELLEGWIIAKMTRNPPHDVVIVLLLTLLGRRLPANWHCRGQSALSGDVSEPEPDVAVVRGARDYLHQHPRARDTGLAIEVSDTTLASDRALKGLLYARLGIPIYWIVNLQEAHIEVFTDPTGPDPAPCYRQRRDYGLTETVPLVPDGREVTQIPVSDLLP